MARSMYRTPIRYSKEQAYEIIQSILASKKYHQQFYNNDYIWKEGVGVATAMHYIKISFDGEQTLQISGWIMTGLGNAQFGEQNLHGAFGAIPKKQVQGVISEILYNISADPAICADAAAYVKAHSGDSFRDLPCYPPAPAAYDPAGNPVQPQVQAVPPVQTVQPQTQTAPIPVQAITPQPQVAPTLDQVSAPIKRATGPEQDVTFPKFCFYCGEKLNVPAGFNRPFFFCRKCGQKIEP